MPRACSAVLTFRRNGVEAVAPSMACLQTSPACLPPERVTGLAVFECWDVPLDERRT
jgi:hypothetical protein